jgi:integrase
MPVVALTDRFCALVKPSVARVDYTDAHTRGLMLRVTPKGAKTFALLFSDVRGERGRLTLGRYPGVSLAQARAMALEALSRAKDGDDPRRARHSTTLRDLLPVYIRLQLKNLRSGKEVERRLIKNVIPIIGDTPLAELHRRDINKVLEPVLARDARVEAARVFENMRAFLRWAVSRGDLDHSPIEGVRKPQTPGPRERVLSDREIAMLWHSLPEALPRVSLVQTIIKLCLLSAQRLGEVAGITPSELDPKQRLWTISAKRSKNKHPHTVPLTEEAFALAEIIAAAGEKVPSDRVGKIIRSAQTHFGMPHWTAHDLRRTVVTRMGELGIAPIVRAHVVNHRTATRAGITLGVYDHYDYAKEKREALNLWATHLDAIVQGGAKVLPMRRA